MNWIADFEQTTAYAAAAYAISTIDESTPQIWNEATYSPDTSTNKSKAEDIGILPESRKIAPKFSEETSGQSFKDLDITKKGEAKDTRIVPEPRKSPLKFSDDTSKQSFKDPDKKMPEKTSFAEINETNGNKPGNQELEKARERDQATGRPPTFADKHSDAIDSTKPETPVQTRRKNVRKPGPRDYLADAWTKEEMTSIKERYEGLRATIDNWEAKKRMKANLKMERTQAKLEKRRAEAVESGKMERIKAKLEKKRAKAVRSYRSEMSRIEEIAAGARAQAEENRRNEEFKVKEKANRIRLTGELPKKCPCF